MNILAGIEERLSRLSCFAELAAPAPDLPARVLELSDRSVVEVARDLAGIANDVARLQALVAGVAAHRSQRNAGQSGLAATEGHATPASLIQDITGGSKADALRQVRVGKALLEDAIELDQAGPEGGGADPDAGGEPAADAQERPSWTAVLRDAHLAGRLTSDQHDAIRRGLGEPHDDSDDAAQVWAIAATQLIGDAATLVLEDLAVHARALRDALDPAGAEERYARRYENRSFRSWIDKDGQHRGTVVFDDEGALWWESIRSAGLRPRRGGPRFLTDEERADAARLQDDPRSNDQLAYDLFMSVMQAGSLAEAKDVFGVRQPGVRVIVVKDPADAETAAEPGAEAEVGAEAEPGAEAEAGAGTEADGHGEGDVEAEVDGDVGPRVGTPGAGRPVPGPRDAFGRLRVTGFAEDGGQPLPGSVIDRYLCMNGSTEVVVDARGNPLDAGREHRLFQPRQRLALAARDGGCMWPGCSMPGSYCEAHHIDPVAGGGRTDIDRGILLCRYHHLLLHNRGWRISREGHGAFILHPPPDIGGEATVLVSKAAWKWAWDPPPTPGRRRWRAA